MSDSEGDFSDELLELAGATEKKRRKRQAQTNSTKRRKADVSMGSDSDNVNEPESEEDDGESNPYPLEGKYTDEADRERLLGLSEIEREDILAQRQEEMQRIKMRSQLDQMVKDQNGRKDDNNISKTAKRQHTQRGATKEKTRKLDELKAKRKAKDERKRTDSPKRDRSSSPMDMETSEEEDEDGQVSKLEEEEERLNKIYGKDSPAEEEPIAIEDLEKVRISRDHLAKYCLSPWFEDYVKGAWVRYLIGMDEAQQPIYRACEVVNLGANLVKPYKINDRTINQVLELKHGAAIKTWAMDKVSNSPFTSREFDRLVRVFDSEKIKLPSKRQIEKKAEQIHKFATQPMTESDINAMLARKHQLQASKLTGTALTMERSRLSQARTLALRRHDQEEVQQIDAKLVELSEQQADSKPSRKQEESVEDILAKVNERNRRANAEAIRKAELRETERKRRERKLALANGSATPTTPNDPSGRLKSTSKFLSSRPGTPGIATPGPTDIARSVSPLPAAATTISTTTPSKPSSGLKSSFEASVLESVDIDLGDF
ncbi:unnamed protein product [Somion occarium]|uniref:Plus3 domain-containing protein n=1 Tax=Somion occarium TaxID=3059160 RepID=A0ABP1DQF4_9APHY